ncbi:hypothetical protein MKX01_036560 [Papaver californicum]|nr:hypothetical protein MKX01_036560 [Papaver californicum]
MAKHYLWVLLTIYLFSTILILQAFALTYPSDVTVLQDLYKSLNQPPHLVGWKLNRGDPCEESWKGISCSGSSVMFIKINGLELNGSLGGNLFSLFNLKQLDVSFNNIEGEIPSSLPPNATHFYLHSTGSPPVAHNNLKAANVLLDDEFMPRLCDSGLAVLKPFLAILLSSRPLKWH